jgi:NAD-dependent deacetylase
MSPAYAPGPAQERVIGALRTARRVTFLTGAGISAESGIATFRAPQTGLWARYDAAELATPAAFARDPALVWGWYEWRRREVRRAQPNPGHRAIAELARRIPRFVLITQNVDDLHERAGSPDVIHLHGELARSVCATCGAPFAAAVTAPGPKPPPPAPPPSPPIPPTPLSAPDEPAGPAGPLEPPRCAGCGSPVRPGVVWFGEALPREAWQRALQAARESELFFCCGTSSLVQPAASLTDLAAAAGAMTVQINPDLTGIEERVDVALRGKAGEVLPALIARTWSTG